MTTTKHPENQQPQAGHDLGQISIKTLLENIEAWQERVADDMLHTKPGDPMHDYYDGQHAAFETVAEFIKKQKKGLEIREGMSDYIGPPRPVWDLSKKHEGRDPYASTGKRMLGRSLRDEWWSGSIDIAPLDAPNEIAGGGHRQNIFSDDPELNVFPITTQRP